MLAAGFKYLVCHACNQLFTCQLYTAFETQQHLCFAIPCSVCIVK